MFLRMLLYFGVESLYIVPISIGVVDFVITIPLTLYTLLIHNLSSQTSVFQWRVVYLRILLALDVALLISSPMMISGVTKSEPSYIFQWVMMQSVHTVAMTIVLVRDFLRSPHRLTLMFTLAWNLIKWCAIVDVHSYYQLLSIES